MILQVARQISWGMQFSNSHLTQPHTILTLVIIVVADPETVGSVITPVPVLHAEVQAEEVAFANVVAGVGVDTLPPGNVEGGNGNTGIVVGRVKGGAVLVELIKGGLGITIGMDSRCRKGDQYLEW